jgi:hypothetical protein
MTAACLDFAPSNFRDGFFSLERFPAHVLNFDFSKYLREGIVRCKVFRLWRFIRRENLPS